MNRIENLKAYADRKENEQKAKDLKLQAEMTALKDEIESLWPRAEELLNVANECRRLGIKFPKAGKFPNDEMDFVSNSWSHRLGFGCCETKGFGIAHAKHYDSISIRGGGCCHYEIDLCDGTLYYEGKDAKCRLDLFVGEFDAFEKRFYSWVDKLTEQG